MVVILGCVIVRQMTRGIGVFLVIGGDAIPLDDVRINLLASNVEHDLPGTAFGGT